MADALPAPVAHSKPTRSFKTTPVSILWSYLHHKRWIWSMPAASERSNFVPTTSTLILEAILKTCVLCGRGGERCACLVSFDAWLASQFVDIGEMRSVQSTDF